MDGRTDQRHHSWRLAALTLAALTIAGCDFVMGFMDSPPEEQLAQAALDKWASPGAPFVEARFSQDTVGTVTETGPWSWVVTLPDAGGQTWAFEVTRAEVLPVYDGPAYIAWLESTARGLGFRSFIPADAKNLVSSGSIAAVGDLEVAYGRSERQGRSPIERVALLVVDGENASWRIEDEGNRSVRVLRDALRVVYQDMVTRDERVHTCMGSVNPSSVDRAVQLACIAETLDLEYGDG